MLCSLGRRRVEREKDMNVYTTAHTTQRAWPMLQCHNDPDHIDFMMREQGLLRVLLGSGFPYTLSLNPNSSDDAGEGTAQGAT